MSLKKVYAFSWATFNCMLIVKITKAILCHFLSHIMIMMHYSQIQNHNILLFIWVAPYIFSLSILHGIVLLVVPFFSQENWNLLNLSNCFRMFSELNIWNLSSCSIYSILSFPQQLSELCYLFLLHLSMENKIVTLEHFIQSLQLGILRMKQNLNAHL